MRRAAIAVTVGLLLSSCAGGRGTQELTVFAASSLGGAFRELAASFESRHEGVTVVLNLGPSDGLAAQIEHEGTADVFASASERWMDAVAGTAGIEDRIVFATNRLVIVTPPDDPAGVSSISDLARPGLQLVLAAEGVPAGEYARQALANAGVAEGASANVVSNEEDNAGVVAKVVAGEADAGIVYASDVSAAAGNDLRAVEIPAGDNVVATYPIATIVGGAPADLARAFVDLVAGPEGQAVVQRYGFGPPGG